MSSTIEALAQSHTAAPLILGIVAAPLLYGALYAMTGHFLKRTGYVPGHGEDILPGD